MASKIISVIFNPASAGGRTGKKLSIIKEHLNKYFCRNYVLQITSKPLDATRFAREALKKGQQTIIAVGGDGTIQEVVNGFFEKGIMINRQARLGIINCGTGCGMAQSLNLPQELDKQFKIIQSENCQHIDIGKVVYRNGGLSPSIRYFVNELQLGIGGAVVNEVQSRHKKIGGFLAFGLTTISTIFKQPNQRMSIRLDKQGSIDQEFLGIIIANGAYTGGGMNLAPHALLNDHLLDVLLIHAQSIPQRLRTFPKIYSGRHIELPQFSYFHVKQVSIHAKEDVLLEADGEFLGHPPCHVEIIGSCIQVFTNDTPSKSCADELENVKKKGS